MTVRIAATSMSLILVATSSAVLAQTSPVADFYKGRTINLILSAGEGGGYSSYARAFASHFTQHIPGKPTIVVQNMPGGGGIRAMNYLFNQAPKDGTAIGFPHSSVPFAPLYGTKGAQFDPRQAHWLGSLNTSSGICVAWAGAGIKTWQDVLTKEYIVGGTGAGSQMETLPTMLNKLFGAKFRIISGYKGGNDVYLAMERGEVHGRCGGLVSSIQSTRPDWFPKKMIEIPVQIAMKRSDMFPDIPAIGELTKDERTRQILGLVLAQDRMDRPYFLPPGVPAERIAALRQAFADAFKDPAFQDEAKRVRIEIDYVSGEEVAGIITESYALPPDVVKAANDALNAQAGDAK